MTDNPADTELGGKNRKAKDVLADFHIRGCRELPKDKFEECKTARIEAQATLRDDLLAIVGKDEAIDCALLKDFGYHAKICDEPQNDCYGKEQRNKVKAELRKAIRNYFGEDE